MPNNNIKDVAKNLINISNNKGYHISNLKLNLLLYFAQGECYAFTGEPMFSESLYAYGNGPISLDVYQSYCGYGAANIPKEKEVLVLSDTDTDLLNKVVDVYGSMNIWELSDISKAQSPWEFTNGVLGSHKMIFNDFIKSAFSIDDISFVKVFENSHIDKKETLFQRIAKAKSRNISQLSDKNSNVINPDIKTR